MIKHYETLTATYGGALLQFNEDKINCSLSGVSHSISNVWITVPYKNHQIHIDNEYGISNSALVEMEIENGFIPAFTIDSRSHFQNLFSFKKKRFIVKCDNLQYKKILEGALITSGMDQISKDNLFEPTIKVENKNGVQFINTAHHLQFNDKIGGVKALIDFYKIIVDRL